MSKLAIHGGEPVRKTLFPSQNTIGKNEKDAVQRVMDSGVLTGYQGSWGPNFLGGKEVRALEEEWEERFNVKHAIACNSATSGLQIACGAVGMDKADVGDSLVTPFSMTCSATVPMYWKHGVRFTDIERDYYCMDARSVDGYISGSFNKYAAVIPVSLFGQPYDHLAINKILNTNEARTGKKTYVIEDAAQALGSAWYDKKGVAHYAGTLGDIGVYSFNLGKHLTCGEGGMLVTNNTELAMRCRLIMNHAEAVVNGMTEDDNLDGKYTRLYGFNLRLSELHAAIVRVQLAKMDTMLWTRHQNVSYLRRKLEHIPCLTMPKIRPDCTHTFYVMPVKFNSDKCTRDVFVDAVKAELQPVTDRESEGVTIGNGYIRPIQNMPLFGRSLDETPECKRQYQDELIIIHRMFGPNAKRQDLDDIANAFEKVANELC